MPEKVAPNSGRKLIAGVLLIALITVAAVTAFRRYEAQRASPEAPAAQSPAAARPTPTPASVPLAPPPALGRADLLAAIASAASAYAAGEEPGGEPSLIGRRFRLALPFGCAGPGDSTQNTFGYWEYGPDGRTVRVVARAEDWTESAFAQGLGADVERVEGFWISRPWLLSEACPAQRSDPLAPEAAAAAPATQTAGLARVFERGGSRLPQRAGRPFEVTLPVSGDSAPPAPAGFRLILEGRITGFAGEREIACRSSSPDQRPVCLVGVEIERVAITDPAGDAVLGEWRT